MCVCKRLQHTQRRGVVSCSCSLGTQFKKHRVRSKLNSRKSILVGRSKVLQPNACGRCGVSVVGGFQQKLDETHQE